MLETKKNEVSGSDKKVEGHSGGRLMMISAVIAGVFYFLGDNGFTSYIRPLFYIVFFLGLGITLWGYRLYYKVIIKGEARLQANALLTITAGFILLSIEPVCHALWP